MSDLDRVRVLSCPRCAGRELDVVEHERHHLDLCGACRGMWLDAGEWSSVIGPAASPAKLAALGGGSADAPRCPACIATSPLAPRLHARMILGADDVVLDACPTCSGAWLDGGELAKLRQSLAASRARVPGATGARSAVAETVTMTMGTAPATGTATATATGVTGAAPDGPGPKDAWRYQSMGEAMLSTAGAGLGLLLEMASRPPRRRGLFGRRRRGTGGLFALLARLLRP